MSKEETDFEARSKILLNVAMKEPGHLKKWLQESGRRWLVFDSLELVDSLPFPDGLDTLMQIIACYRDHRRAIPSGGFEEMPDPTLGQKVRVPLMKDENLEVAEMDRLIRYYIGKASEKDPNWKLDNPPL